MLKYPGTVRQKRDVLGGDKTVFQGILSDIRKVTAMSPVWGSQIKLACFREMRHYFLHEQLNIKVLLILEVHILKNNLIKSQRGPLRTAWADATAVSGRRLVCALGELGRAHPATISVWLHHPEAPLQASAVSWCERQDVKQMSLWSLPQKSVL